MAPGSGTRKVAYANYDVSMIKAEVGNTPIKRTFSLAEKHGNDDVHELLQCPSCANSMYPPIHQVCT